MAPGCTPTPGTNVAGAVTAGGAAVTAKSNGGTMTLDNGIVQLVITCASGQVSTITWNGINVLEGGTEGGKLYWELEAGNGSCTLSADPSTNGGTLAEVRIHTTGSTNNLDVDIDYALLQGSNGFYATGILSHPASYAAVNGGEWRSNIYIGTEFNWLAVDALRNKQMCTIADWSAAVAVAGAPKEVEKLTTGIYAGQYECKYSYSADFGDEDAWGFVDTVKNIGWWVTKPSGEYYNGGPKKRELTCQAGNAMLNMLGGDHYLQNVGRETIAAGTDLTKFYGPFFYYFNKTSAVAPAAAAADGGAVSSTVPNLLFADAIAQAKAEQAAWPYSWFVNTGVGPYVQESGRGTVTGTLAITDPGAPNASAADMWIGLAPDDGIDFQAQFFTYQFWVKTGADGSFTIPHVIPGSYALYAFGRGAAGTFKQATDVTVTAGQTLALGTVSWTPARTAATVWEIGVPDRDSHEFLNGSFNYSLWATNNVDYTTNFGNGVTYTVGTDDYSKVWNQAMMGAGTWTVNFTMATAPTGQGRFYMALAANEGSAMKVSINGTSIGTLTPGDTSDAVIRLGSHGAFWDGDLTFDASALKAGANTLTITQSASGATEWDYLRLEAGAI
jgi:rhamnogalacturonan endolyase